MSGIKYIPGKQLSYLATTVAVALSEHFDLDDLNILGNVFNAIGDSIAIIASQQEAANTLAENAAKAKENATDSNDKQKSDTNVTVKPVI